MGKLNNRVLIYFFARPRVYFDFLFLMSDKETQTMIIFNGMRNMQSDLHKV